MKFDKFGAFPKTDGVKVQESEKSDMMSTFLKLIPNLFAKQRQPEKSETTTPEKDKNPPTLSPDTIAYREYLARHDAHIKASKGK